MLYTFSEAHQFLYKLNFWGATKKLNAPLQCCTGFDWTFHFLQLQAGWCFLTSQPEKNMDSPRKTWIRNQWSLGYITEVKSSFFLNESLFVFFACCLDRAEIFFPVLFFCKGHWDVWPNGHGVGKFPPRLGRRLCFWMSRFLDGLWKGWEGPEVQIAVCQGVLHPKKFSYIAKVTSQEN